MLPDVICYGGLNHSEKVATIVGIRNSASRLSVHTIVVSWLCVEEVWVSGETSMWLRYDLTLIK